MKYLKTFEENNNYHEIDLKTFYKSYEKIFDKIHPNMLDPEPPHNQWYDRNMYKKQKHDKVTIFWQYAKDLEEMLRGKEVEFALVYKDRTTKEKVHTYTRGIVYSVLLPDKATWGTSDVRIKLKNARGGKVRGTLKIFAPPTDLEKEIIKHTNINKFDL